MLKTQVATSNGSDSNSFPLRSRKNKAALFPIWLSYFQSRVRTLREKIISNRSHYRWQLGFKWTLYLICLLSIQSLLAKEQPCCGFQMLPAQPMDLPRQDRALIRGLILINYPPENWKIEISPPSYDVAIIGGGMAGL